MRFSDFIDKYDFKNSVILLEGKREVLEEDKLKLFSLGKLLAANSTHMTFRSGNAEGADQFFSEGVASIDPGLLEVIIPYSGHRKKSNKASNSIALDNINILEEPEVIYQSKKNKKTVNLIDQFVSGKKDRYTLKAAYIIRDTIKAIGTKEIKPANFGIFYDNLNEPRSGGTGHTMNICEINGIQIIDQKIWFEWLYNK